MDAADITKGAIDNLLAVAYHFRSCPHHDPTQYQKCKDAETILATYDEALKRFPKEPYGND